MTVKARHGNVKAKMAELKKQGFLLMGSSGNRNVCALCDSSVDNGVLRER